MCIRDSPYRVQLNTANGETIADQCLPMQVAPLGETVKPLVLENTPAVLSIGRRCMIDGYSFHWPKFKKPHLISPNGYKIVLEIENFVPYLREYFSSDCNPAAEENLAEGNFVPPKAPIALQPVVQQVDQVPDANESVGQPVANKEFAAQDTPKNLSAKELLVYHESKSLKHQLCHLPQNPF